MNTRSDARPTPYLILCVFLLALLNMQDGFDILAISFAAHSISEDWGISRSSLGIVFSAGLFGMMLGAMVLGPLADKYGRKPICILGLILSGCGMLVAMSAGGLQSMVAGRVLTGLGVGAILASVNTLVSEYAGDRHRVVAIALFQLGFPMGAFISGFLAAWLIGIGSWRYVFAFGAFTSFTFIPIVLCLPESTTFLAKRGNKGDLEAINRTRSRFGRAVLAEFPQRTDVIKPGFLESLKGLFHKKLLPQTLLIWTAFFLLLTTLYFLLSWTPKMIVDMGFSEIQGNRGGRLINLTGMLGIVLLGVLSLRILPAMITAVYLSILSVLLIVFSRIGLEFSLILILIGCIGVFIHGAMIGLYSTVPSIYPSHLRATGTGWAIGISRFGAVLGPAMAGFLFDDGWSTQNIFLLFAVPAALASIAVFMLWLVMRAQPTSSRDFL